MCIRTVHESSMCAALTSMASRYPIEKRPPFSPRDPCDLPVMRLVTPRRRSQRSRPREGSVTC